MRYDFARAIPRPRGARVIKRRVNTADLHSPAFTGTLFRAHRFHRLFTKL